MWMEPEASEHSVDAVAFSLGNLPRDVQIVLMKMPGVRRRCMTLNRYFYRLCNHEDYAKRTKALTIRAHSFRAKVDRSEALVEYISKQGPNCVDLAFRECSLPVEIIGEILASRSTILEKLSFFSSFITVAEVFYLLLDVAELWPAFESVSFNNIAKTESKRDFNWKIVSSLRSKAPQLKTIHFHDSASNMIILRSLARCAAQVIYVVTNIEKVSGAIAAARETPDDEPWFYDIERATGGYYVYRDGGSIDMHIPKNRFSQSLKIVISILEIVQSDRDQIEFVDLSGEPFYCYKGSELAFFADRQLLGNKRGIGQKFMYIGLYEDDINAEETSFVKWRNLD